MLYTIKEFNSILNKPFPPVLIKEHVLTKEAQSMIDFFKESNRPALYLIQENDKVFVCEAEVFKNLTSKHLSTIKELVEKNDSFIEADKKSKGFTHFTLMNPIYINEINDKTGALVID